MTKRFLSVIISTALVVSTLVDVAVQKVKQLKQQKI